MERPPGHVGSRAMPQPFRERQSPPARTEEELIGRQAEEIIDEVLALAGPGGEEVRQRLRQHVAASPGRPAQALLEHLIAIRGRGVSPRTMPPDPE